MGWEDDDDILLWVRGGHCSKVLLRPAVAEVLVIGVAADKAADASDQACDGARDEAGHFGMIEKLKEGGGRLSMGRRQM